MKTILTTILLGSILIGFVSCRGIDLKETCQGEWSYIVGDTAYCEILITESAVFPYHFRHNNSYSCHYLIQNDTFFLYGNEGVIVESSPINYIDKNTFEILGITNSPLKRVVHKDEESTTLADYNYKISRLLANKHIVDVLETDAYPKMELIKSAYEEKFHQRRDFALYKHQQALNQSPSSEKATD